MTTCRFLIDIIKIEPDFSRGRLSIEIANKGTTDATSLESTLTVNGKVMDVEYSSTLKATKKTTLSYPLVIYGTGILEIKYRGPGLENNVVTKEITLDFEAPAADGTTTYLIVVVVVVIIGYWLWRRRKKK